MGDGADGNKVDTGFGNGANRFQRHAAAGFGEGAAADDFDSAPQQAGRHIIKENDIGSFVGGLGGLGERVCFDFNLEFRIFGASPLDGDGDRIWLVAFQRGEMIVLDQDEIEKSKAMVGLLYPFGEPG